MAVKFGPMGSISEIEPDDPAVTSFLELMERERPKEWLYYLWDLGLNQALSKYMAAPPFDGAWPLGMAIQALIGQCYPDYNFWQRLSFRLALQERIHRDKIISKYLDYKER